jgi:hypothetical protein
MCLCRGAVHTRQVAEPEIRVKPQLAKLWIVAGPRTEEQETWMPSWWSSAFRTQTTVPSPPNTQT